jgi:hypothetical protein
MRNQTLHKLWVRRRLSPKMILNLFSLHSHRSFAV